LEFLKDKNIAEEILYDFYIENKIKFDKIQLVISLFGLVNKELI
jgi:hypothetical protein